MTIDPGEEFRIQATPSPALLRKLMYLATQGNDSVLTGALKSTKTAYKGSGRDRADTETDALLQMARLADPGYQALSDRINAKLDLMDEASVLALQQIEQQLQELQRQREMILDQAYRDERGRRIFMTEDESAAFHEDGTRLEDEDFAPLRERLQGKPTWEKLQRQHDKEDELKAEREQIHRHEAEREGLREDLAEGAISEEEAERREQEIEDSLPERVRRNYVALDAKHAENDALQGMGLSPEEAAALNVRADSEQGEGAGGPGSDKGDAQPAPDPHVPGASPFQPG